MDVIMPQLGETVAEGTLTVWHKAVGDSVKANELLFEIGTDKVEMEIPAPISGVIADIRVSAGETVPVGTTLAVIEDSSGAAKEVPVASPAAATAPPPVPESASSAGSPAVSAARTSPAFHPNRKLSPAVRKLVADNNLDPDAITGTGRDGRITRGDVLEFLKGGSAAPAAAQPTQSPAPAPAPRPANGDGRTVIPFNHRRKMTAEHMVRSKATSPHVLQATEADFSNVDKARKALSADWRNREGFSLTYLPFIAKAVCEAIRDFPNVNSHVQDESLVVFDAVNLAVAVDLNFNGLVAPVVKDADRRSVPDLARAINDVAGRARADKLAPEDFVDATYTITNNGAFGTLLTAPIINQPQVAILSTDAITKKPVVVDVDGEDMIAIRPVGMLAQSFDHRAIDGAYAAAFLKRVKEILETRDWRAAF
jgi:pyruvate dehydrogenase E2 component (dihydrolipoamide acetyltransferase)